MQDALSPVRSPSPEEILRTFPETVGSDIQGIISAGGVMRADSVRRVTQALDIDVESLMLRLVPWAATYAVPSVSRYFVGAVAQGSRVDEHGTPCLYLGANMEFLQRALSYSLHAEQSAIANAWFHREPGVKTLAVSAPPCGYCRQFLNELSASHPANIVFPKQDGAGYLSTDIDSLLPSAFGPADLGHSGDMMAVASNPHNLLFTSREGRDMAAAGRNEVELKALAAARHSYAPYTKNFSGCALQLLDGSLFTGSYAENAAHNPGLSPLHAAISNMRMGSGPGALFRALPEIRRCVLVEAVSDISQRDLSANLLASIAPGVPLEYHTVQSG